MKAFNRSFPYPVAAPFRDDIYDNGFKAELAVTSDKNAITFAVRYEISNPTLKSLLAAQNAYFSLHLEAKNLYFRELYSTRNTEQEITISGSELLGPVEWLPMMISSESIPDYRPVNMHEDYGESIFPLNKNEILAVGYGGRVIIEQEFDPLKKISSIMQIIPNSDSEDDPFQAEFGSEKITIYLSQQDHGNYTLLRSTPALDSVLCNAIVLPCLIEAIRILRDNDELTKKWAVVLRRRLEQINQQWKTEDDFLKLAQQILDSPLSRGLNQLLEATGERD